MALAIACVICMATPPRKVDANPTGCPSSIVYLYSYHASEPFAVDSPTYDTTFGLTLTDVEKEQLVQYLLSL